MCLCDRANSPARGPRARAGPGPHIFNCFAGRAGPGHTCSGPGPGLIIQFAGRARAGSSQLLRARAGPGPQIIFAGRAWALILGPCRTLPWIVCPFVLWSERRALRGGLFVLCRSVGVLCETRLPLRDRLAWRAERCATHCVSV